MEINKSKDLKAEEAIALFAALLSAEEINAFIEGDGRKTVLAAAAERKKVLADKPASGQADKQKQGEQKDPITAKTTDFKGPGVQGAKGPSEHPSNPRTLESSNPRSYVTGEDVIAKMRAEGKKI